MQVSLRYVCLEICLVTGYRRREVGHLPDDLVYSSDATATNVRFAEEEVGKNSNDRQRGDDNNPGDP